MFRHPLIGLACSLALVSTIGCGNSNGGEASSDSHDPDTSVGSTPDAGSPSTDGTTRSDDADASENAPPCELERPEPGEPFERLRDYCFFRGDPADQDGRLSEGVVPYAVRSKLYSDESHKFRFLVLPENGQIDYDRRELWGFPEGTIVVKTFYFPHDARQPDAGRRLLETRLMVKRNGAWKPRVYKWNASQTKATRHLVGDDVEVQWTNEKGEEVTTDYRVPTENKCKSCHMRDNDLTLLGPRTRQLNRPFEYASGEANQLEHLEQQGLFDTNEIDSPDELPQLPDPKNEDLPLEKRARAYLEGNCAHCHNAEGGGASNSGLFLNYRQDDRRKLGVCLHPTAAGSGTGGYEYDIKPGHPGESIMVYRMEASDPEIKMPELPLRTVDRFGVRLIRDWIAQMEPEGCKNR
jgi:uncharacterized repeat protein (TIGR03806 family)